MRVPVERAGSAELATPSYRESVALGVAQGILNYFALVNRAKVELGAPVQQRPAQMAARWRPRRPRRPLRRCHGGSRRGHLDRGGRAGALCGGAGADLGCSASRGGPVRLRGRGARAPAAAVPAPAPIWKPQAAPRSPPPAARRAAGHRAAAHEPAESQSGHPRAIENAGRNRPHEENEFGFPEAPDERDFSVRLRTGCRAGVPQEAESFAAEVRTDVHGNVDVVVNPGGSPRVMLAGHYDEIGFIVTLIDSHGFLWISPIGGWDAQIPQGQRVAIRTAKGVVPGIIGKGRPRAEPTSAEP